MADAHAVLALLTEGTEAEQHRSRPLKLIALIQPSPRDPRVLSSVATTYEELGDRVRALAWLEQAIRAGYSVRRIDRSPWLKDLRGDERYARLRR